MRVFKVKETRLTFQKIRSSALYCCVPLCSNSSRYTSVSFHSFPADNAHREKWLMKIRREHFSPATSTMVCSRHFLPVDIVTTPIGRHRVKKGAVPLLFAWNGYTQPNTRLSVWEPPPANPPLQKDDTGGSVSDVVVDHDYCMTAATGAMGNELLGDVKALPARIRELEGQMERSQLWSRFGLQRIPGSNDQILFFTRFSSYVHFQYFWKLIEPAVIKMMVKVTSTKNNSGDRSDIHHTPMKLPAIDELLLFLMHLSVGLYPPDLAERFNIHCSTVSRIITTWTNFLYELLGKRCLWLPREVVRAHLPPEFAAFPDTQVVLYCTDISYQTPSDFLLQDEVNCTYKSHSTLKAMIGIAPHGVITFISALYTSSTSDQEIFMRSGIINLLKPDMAIMVDKGFLVENLAPCKVYQVAFRSKKNLGSWKNICKVQSIARVRARVERCIQRVKENKLFDRVIPVSVCGNINVLFSVACLLVNYQN